MAFLPILPISLIHEPRQNVIYGILAGRAVAPFAPRGGVPKAKDGAGETVALGREVSWDRSAGHRT